jgi:chloramphenicol-sensitive protein RarD
MATRTAPAAYDEDTPRGFAFALVAYLLWGFLPFYMKAVSHIPAVEVVAHRVVWSVPIAAVVLICLAGPRISGPRSGRRGQWAWR